MSSLFHDRHSLCNVCRGFVCTFEKRCGECEQWSDECMHKFLKHMRFLESKSKSHKAKKSLDVSDQGSYSASGESSVKSTDPASASSGVSEARVVELVQSQFSQFSSSFAACMEASFANIQSFIEDRLSSHVSQDVHVSNPSVSAPSPAPVYQASSQSQTNPSVRSPRIGCGPGGEAQEPGQVESATSSFLAALNAVGIQVPLGVSISDRVVRESSSAAAQAGAPPGVQAEMPLRSLGVSATEQVNVGSSTLGISLHEEAFRAVTFSDTVQECAEDDAMSSVSEKVQCLRVIVAFCCSCISCVLRLLRSLPLRRTGCVTSRVCLLWWTDLLPLRVSPPSFITCQSCGQSIASTFVQLRSLASFRRWPCRLVVATVVLVQTLHLRRQHPSTLGFPFSISARFLSHLTRPRGWNPCVKGCWRLSRRVLVVFGAPPLAEGVGICGSRSQTFWPVGSGDVRFDG